MKEKHILFFIVMFQFSCTINQNDKLITNSNPQFIQEDFIELKLSHQIPTLSEKYSISLVTHMAADNENNLFVLSRRESSLYKFNKSGDFQSLLGGKGQGPKELEGPGFVTITDDNLSIVNGNGILKIWDKAGEYKQSITFPTTGIVFIHKSNNGYYNVTSYMKNPFLVKYEIYSTKLNGKEKIQLLEYDHDRSTNFHLLPNLTIAFDKNDNYYFPANDSKYLISKYNKDGKLLFSFGREYERKSFSSNAVNTYNNRYELLIKRGMQKEIPDYPPIIRRIFMDSRENIWVMTGELNMDSENNTIPISVDIFSKDGKWLTELELSDFSILSFIKNNRLYNTTKIVKRFDQQYINVYEIEYLRDN